MIGADVAAALSDIRAEADSRMTSTCEVVAPGEQVWNPTTGVYIDQGPVVHYVGPCRLRMGNPAPQNADAGEAAWAADRGVLSLPISDPSSANVLDGMTVTITANPHDPAMVGLELTVLAPHYQTDSTARRLPVQLVTRDAAVPQESGGSS